MTDEPTLTEDEIAAIEAEADDARGDIEDCGDGGGILTDAGERLADIADRLLVALRHERARADKAEAALGLAEKMSGKTMDERDYFAGEVERLAACVGCEHEWSNLHAHATCIDDGIAALSARSERAEAIAKAERAARKAEEEVWLGVMGHDDGKKDARMEALRQARAKTYAALRALGVEP